jgi:aminoacyl-tRNA hydrolase
VARQALDAADLVLFVGPRSSKATKARKHPKGDALHAFYSAEAAAEYLDGVLRAGDLVLLKGSERADRFDLLLTPAAAKARPADLPRAAPAGRPRVVVGLGNPGERYRDTPHNVGHRVLDRLAGSLGGAWEPAEGALVAAVERQGAKLHLVKLMTAVNSSGPALAGLARALGFGPADCVLVHDDLDLALGTSRARPHGSDGGHKGVRSVLQTFGTDAIARVKVGVGRPDRSGKAAGYVVRPFSPEELAVIEAACGKAAESVLGLVSPADGTAGSPSPGPEARPQVQARRPSPVGRAVG